MVTIRSSCFTNVGITFDARTVDSPSWTLGRDWTSVNVPQARRVCLLFHGSASCVHGKRRWRFPERVHLVKRRKKCSCDRWSVRLTRVTSWMSWESGPALKDWLGSSKFCAILLLFISDMVQAKTMGNASIEPVPDVLRHLIHGIGWDICLKQRVSLAVPRRKRVTSARRATTQGPI